MQYTQSKPLMLLGYLNQKMSIEPGRNDLCPCNSGRKYKDCHMRSVLNPKEGFQVRIAGGKIAQNEHMESVDGQTWVSKPGRFAFRVYYQEEVNDVIDNLIKPLHDTVPQNRFILRQRIDRLRHKLYGVRYHLDNFIEQEEKDIATFKTSHEGSDHDSILNEPRLIYEVESFLFQIKSTLDVLAQIIGMIYRLNSITTYSNGGAILAKTLKLNTPGEVRLNARKLAVIIESHVRWVDNIVDMRDEVTHFSELTGFSCFISHAWNGGPVANISYPSMPNGDRARTYMENAWRQLLDLIEEVSPILIQNLGSRQETSVPEKKS